jgi:hypothetical protein
MSKRRRATLVLFFVLAIIGGARHPEKLGLNRTSWGARGCEHEYPLISGHAAKIETDIA